MSRPRRRLAILCTAVALPACAATRPAEPRDRVLRPCPSSPNCVSTESDDPLPPFRLALPPRDAWPRVRDAIGALSRCRIADESPTYLRAECTSLLFRFVDDLEIELRMPSRLAVRSASRLGYSDLGVNWRRVERLREILVAEGVVREER